MMEVIAEQLDL